MNNKALELGLTSTHFVTPHGLDNNNHFTTAYDLAILTDYALTNEIFSKIVKTKTYTITLNGYPKTLSNTNELLGNLEGVYGVKTGFTNGANRCLITCCKRGDLDIICVVLGADTKKDRTKDSIKLIEHTFQNYEVVNIKEIIVEEYNKWKDINEKRIIINKGIEENPKLVLENMPYEKVAMKKGEKDNIKISLENNYLFEAPLEENSIIGKIECYINESKQFELKILNKELVEKKNVLNYFIELLQKFPANYCLFE